MHDNSGVIATGNNINVNTGSGSATQKVRSTNSRQTVSLSRQIDQLLTELMTNACQLPADQAKVIEDKANWLGTEIRSEEFRHGRIWDALAALGTAAGEAAPIVELVNQLRELIARLLH